MKIITIIGARPQFIKSAVISRAIGIFNKANSENIEEIVIHTGQHYDSNMSDIFFSEMCIPIPKYNLNVGGGLHGSMTGKMLEEIEQILITEKPDLVLVYGDTNSTLAGALAATKLHVPVAHIEAGLRSFNKQMPEEINRILTDNISNLLFCPTQTAVSNLQIENIINKNDVAIHNVGDVMYDATLFYKNIAHPTENITRLIEKVKSNFYLVTIHREENTNNINNLLNIIKSLKEIAKSTPVIWSIHPRTNKVIKENNINTDGLTIIEPVGYFDMITLLSKCNMVFTDSGGVQKEAYFFQKPCVTMRDETEWAELVEHGYNKLVGADYNKILKAEKEFENIELDFSTELYGNGEVGNKIVEIIAEKFKD